MHIKLWIVAAFLSIGMAYSQQVTKTMLRLPDTGQNTSYTNTFGEDNDYSINVPYFINNGNGTVTDTITGLMWMKTDVGDMTIEQARIYCDTLSAGGYSDWRLPDAHEAFSILNHQKTNPAIETTVFSATTAEYWWSSTRQMNDSNKIWVTNAGGGIGNHPKTEAISAGGNKRFYVRAVRNGMIPTIIPNRLITNSDGTIKDTLTGLIWQAIANIKSDTITWEDALTYANTYQTTNIAKWRIPNIKELQSINDEQRINPSLTPGVFASLGVKKIWSSTTLPNQTTQAWYLDTQFGVTTYALKTSKRQVLLVSGNEKITTANIEFSRQNSPFQVYPNPANDFIHIEYTPCQQIETTCNVEIIDMMGKVVYHNDFERNIEVKSLQAGLYTICIKGPDIYQVKKLNMN